MKKITEICYSNSMKINRGQYEQEAPFYSAKTILEENGQPIDEVAEYGRLRGIIDPLLVAQYQNSKLDMAGLRIRVKDSKKYPSVTSILHPEPLNIDPDYAIRGTEIHRLVNHWILTREWQAPQEPLNKIKYEDIKYKEFFEQFKDRINFNDCLLNLEVFHDKHLYSGEIDCIAHVDGLPSLIDFKTGSWDWMQLVAYYKASPTVKQLAIFDLKKTKLEILSLKDPKCSEYWENFLILRGMLKSKFGI